MSLPIYKQYVFPPVNVVAGIIEFRINTDGLISYDRTGTGDVLFLTAPNSAAFNAPAILSMPPRKTKLNDKDGDISADTFGFTAYDVFGYTGRVDDPNTGTIVTEDLIDNNITIFDKMFSVAEATTNNLNPTRPILWATLITPSGREPFFCGTIDTTKITREHVSVFFEGLNEVETRVVTVNAADVISLLSTATIQSLLDTNAITSFTTHVARWYGGVRWDNVAGNVGAPDENMSSAVYYDGGVGAISDPWSGLQAITFGTLIQFIANMCHTDTTGFTIDSAFDFYYQLYDGTSYPLTKYSSTADTLSIIANYLFGKSVFDLQRTIIANFDTSINYVGFAYGFPYYNGQKVWFESFGGSLPPNVHAATDYYVFNANVVSGGFQISTTIGGSAVVFGGTGSGIQIVYPADGDFAYTNSLDRNSTCLNLLSQIAWQFGCTFFTKIGLVGGVYLPQMQAPSRRNSLGAIPTNWQLISSKEDPQFVSQVSVISQNSFDNIQLMVGAILDANNALQITIPYRTHQWGAQTPNNSYNDSSGNTSGLYPPAIRWWNQSLPRFSQSQCFDLYLPPLTTSPPPNYADGWIGSRLMYFNKSNCANIFNHSQWSDSSQGMISLVATTIKGQATPNDGDDYYNSYRATANFYWQEMIGNKICLTREFSGVLSDAGLVQDIRPGLEETLPIRILSNGNNPRTFRAIEVSQDFMLNKTELKYIEKPSSYTDILIPSWTYIDQTGGSSSSSSTNSSNGGSSGGNTTFTDSDFPINSITISSSSNNDVAILSSPTTETQTTIINNTSGGAIQFTGIVAPSQNCTLILYNAGSYTLRLEFGSSLSSAANRIHGSIYANAINTILAGGTAILVYDITNIRWQLVNIFPLPATEYSADFTVAQSGTTDAQEVAINLTQLATDLAPYISIPDAILRVPSGTTYNTIQNASGTDYIDLIIQAVSAQVKDFLQFRDSSANVITLFDVLGKLTIGNSVAQGSYLYVGGDVAFQQNSYAVGAAGNYNDIDFWTPGIRTSNVLLTNGGILPAPAPITTFTGMVAPANQDGFVKIFNRTGAYINFLHQNAGSTATNRFDAVGDILLPDKGCMIWQYSTLGYWLLESQL